jgi:CspA family cold shock protein
VVTDALWATYRSVRYGDRTQSRAVYDEGVEPVQGVIKAYDPGSRDGIVVRDTDLSEVDLAPDALEGSVFRLLRQGQRVIFDLDGEGRATRLRLGSEVDMGTPGLDPERFPPGDDATSD